MKSIVRQLKDGGAPAKLESKTTATFPSASISFDNLASTDYLNLIAQSAAENTDKMGQEDVRPSMPFTLNDVKKALMCLSDRSFEAQFGTDVLVRFWKQTYSFVIELCSVLVTHLPAFWTTCKMYIDGKNLKVFPKCS